MLPEQKRIDSALNSSGKEQILLGQSEVYGLPQERKKGSKSEIRTVTTHTPALLAPAQNLSNSQSSISTSKVSKYNPISEITKHK